MIDHLRCVILCTFLVLGALHASEYEVVEDLEDPIFLEGRHNLLINFEQGLTYSRTIEGAEVLPWFLYGAIYSFYNTMKNGEFISAVRQNLSIVSVKVGAEITDRQLKEWEIYQVYHEQSSGDIFSLELNILFPPITSLDK